MRSGGIGTLVLVAVLVWIVATGRGPEALSLALYWLNALGDWIFTMAQPR